jgi:hypothetical protein
MVEDHDRTRRDAIGRIATGSQGVEDERKHLRLDRPQFPEAVPIFRFQAPKSSAFKNSVHVRGA